MEVYATIEKKEGISKKTGKNYRMIVLNVETEYGDVPITIFESDKAFFPLWIESLNNETKGDNN